MNERIRELAEQAGFSVCRDQWLFNEMIEKFAELIVRECAEVANDKYDKGRCPVGPYIKEHFGVE